MKEFRITWRHEAYILADSDEEARELWESVNLGELNKSLILMPNKGLHSHDFVEEVSFDEEDPLEERVELGKPVRNMKELIEEVAYNETIDMKYREPELKKLEICKQCPSTHNCWGCGNPDPHEWWVMKGRGDKMTQG